MDWKKCKDEKQQREIRENKWNYSYKEYNPGISDKQRALMIKLGVKFDNKTTRKQASELISKALNSDNRK